MLKKFKFALFAVMAVALAPASAMAHAHSLIPAFDKNDMTILDKRGDCVVTKWEGVTGGCGEKAASNNMWRTIFFGFDSDRLTAESKAKLDRLYQKLTDESSRITRANIVGYADEIGTNAYNMDLSKRRAMNVHSYLQGLGYQDSQVTDIRALGERSSQNKCPSSMRKRDRIACLWEDRRVEVELEYLYRKNNAIMR